MEYNEEIAQKIIEEYKLSPQTLKTWKTRNSIPDKYLKSGFEISEAIPAELLPAVERMKEIINHDFFVKRNFVAEGNQSHFIDASLGKIAFNLADLQQFKSKVDAIIMLINKIILNKNKAGTAYEKLMQEILKDKILVFRKIINEPSWSDLEYNQIKGWLDNRRTYPANLTKKIEDTLLKLKVLLQFNFKVE